MQTQKQISKLYRIQLVVAIYRNGCITYRSEIVVPSAYSRRNEARMHIEKEIRERLLHSNFFRSTRPDYDLVRYTEEGSCTTFLRYRILLGESLPDETF